MGEHQGHPYVVWEYCPGGSLAEKKKIPATSGTFPTHGPLFVGLFVGTVVLIAALTFFPALSLGPVVEHFLMHQGKLFSFLSTSQPTSGAMVSGRVDPIQQMATVSM